MADSRIYAIATAKVAADISSTDYLVGDKTGDSTAFKILFTELKKYIGGVEITNSVKKTAIQLNSNWSSVYGADFTGTPIAGQKVGDYFKGVDSATGSIYLYQVIEVLATQTIIRIPLELK